MVRIAELPLLLIQLSILRRDLAVLRRHALAAVRVQAGIQTTDYHDAVLRGFQAFAYQRAHLELVQAETASVEAGHVPISDVLMPIPKALADYAPVSLLQGRETQAAQDVFASMTQDMDAPVEFAERLAANKLSAFSLNDGHEQHDWIRRELGIQRRLVALFVARASASPAAFDLAAASLPAERIPRKLRRWRRRHAAPPSA